MNQVEILPAIVAHNVLIIFVFPPSFPKVPTSHKYLVVDSSVKKWILVYGIPLPQISDSIQYFLKSESIRLKLLIPSGFLCFVFGSYSVKMLLVHEYDVC